MNELTAKLKREPDKAVMGAEVGALNALMGMLNNPNITGAAVPKPGDNTDDGSPVDGGGATMIPSDPAISARPQPAPRGPARPTAAPPTPVHRAITGNKFAFTGRLKVGKDFVATALGARIFGFADPLYALQDHFFGTTARTNPADKDIPGARQFLQTVGQWGWGALSDKYQLTPARACFVTMIRTMGSAGLFPAELGVDWESYGRNTRIWVDAALKRIDAYLAENGSARVAIVNARFKHEYEPLGEVGFERYHVMCSPKTWAARLAKAGLTDKSPAVLDLSEQLSHALDQSVIKQISAQKTGPMLRAIWNDENAPSPSPRIYTTQQFLAAAASAPAGEATPGGVDYASAE